MFDKNDEPPEGLLKFLQHQKQAQEYEKMCKDKAKEMANKTSLSLEKDTLMVLWSFLENNSPSYYKSFKTIQAFTDMADFIKEKMQQFDPPTAIQMCDTLSKLCIHLKMVYTSAEEVKAELEKQMPDFMKGSDEE